MDWWPRTIPLLGPCWRPCSKTQDYFFCVINPSGGVNVFRSRMEAPNLAGLRSNQERFGQSTCTPAQYDTVCKIFAIDPDPPGQLVEWVGRKSCYLDLSESRLELRPRGE